MPDGRYDCIVGGITITPARERILAWTTPYVMTTLSLIVNSTKTPGIRTLANMKGALVGAQAATTDYDAALLIAEARPDRSRKGLPVRLDRGSDKGS